jgi:hypothetical protein
MSDLAAEDPMPGDARACRAIRHVVVPRARDLGSFTVRRALPSVAKQMVGPFVFFDQMGPSEFLLGQGLDVRPHPHIGLSTVTYLFDGEVMHRDSLGVVQSIRPGALNLMTAGRGIVHSERTSPDLRATGSRLYGIQAWAALPQSHEETDPAFIHHAASGLPLIEDRSLRIRVVMGDVYGATSPVRFPHPAFYGEAVMQAGAKLPLDPTYDERAVYVVEGSVDIAGDVFEAGRLLIFAPGDRIHITALTNARLIALGGEPMDGPRHIWWNFVSSRKERIDQAKADWAAARFDTVPFDPEFIPLPAA